MGFADNQASGIHADLLARVAKGDPHSFEELYEGTSPLLFSLAMRILGDRDEAAELLQEVYIEAWQKAALYDRKRGSPVAWLVTLTRSRALDRVRSSAGRSRSVTVSLDDVGEDNLQSYGRDSLERRSDQEMRQFVETAFQTLPEAQQRALELAYYEGLTHQEIAAQLNEPLGTIKTRIKLGMGKLRDALRMCWESK